MSSDPWSRLAAPFPASALAWHAVAREPGGTRARLVPHLPVEALRERLDAVVGPESWSVHLSSWGDSGLIAELTVAGATRAAAARLAPHTDTAEADVATAAAWSAAAAGFGMRTPVVLADEGWVDTDPDTGEPLHPPATTERAAPTERQNAVDGPRGAVPAAGSSGGPPEGGAAAAGGPVRGDAVGADAVGADAVGVDATRTESTPSPAGTTANRDAKPDAQRVIDRLIERLREEGLGAEAAKLVTSYGGYGHDPATSRELYARLRALLIDRSAPA